MAAGGGLLVLLLVAALFSRGGQTILALFTLNHKDVVYYGKLEDQFGNPVAHASVNFEVRVHNGFRSGVERGTVSSDNNGFFKISGYSGARLFVTPLMDGYAIASENRQAVYSDLWPAEQRAHPDAQQPVVLKMWKAQGGEPLVGINKKFKLPYTNAPLSFDLLKGTLVATGGDIRLTVTRPQGTISEQNPQVWSVRFDVVDGGLVDAAGTERITYFAPEEGYQTSETISSTDRRPSSGLGGFDTGLYVKSRHGQVFSKLLVGFGINQNEAEPMDIEFSGVANTNRSRNWEDAPNTYLNPD